MATKGTPLSKALSLWEEKNGKPAAEAEEIKLIFLVLWCLPKNPPIDKLETSVLSTLTRVEKLSISSNSIDKIVNFPPLKYLTRLSLARNCIRKISGLEEVAGTLKELWLSYNLIEKLEGLSMCTKLTSLFIGSKC